jgi:N-acetylglucosaminyldiphosphoundecaprenol N-acetyl-beta-D-mannosaminyltransferase
MPNQLSPQKRIDVVGSKYSVIQKEAAYQHLLDHAINGGSGYVCVSNVHTTMTGYFNADYQKITNDSLLSVPDGVPLVWAMKSMGAQNQDRIRGPSMMKDLARLGVEKNIRHFLYGGSPTTIAKLKSTLEKNYPGIQIVGAESPPFKPIEEITKKDWQEAADKINAANPHFIWIGLGAPKQEIWMYRQQHEVKGVMFGIGAAFDLLAGNIPEAPMALQRLGLEWAYRLFKEPKRLWRRYVLNNPLFLVLWLFQLVSFRIQKS